MTGTALVIVAGTLAAVAFNPFKLRKRAAMTESMANARTVKLILDSFAIDNDGVYPSDETAPFYELPENSKWSNDIFRQLFASGNANSERIFWVKGAKVCNPNVPDDVTTKGGRLDPKETLKAGDCGMAYMGGQTNTDNPVRPVLLDAYKPGGKEFDRKQWGDKVIVIHIDGSAKAIELNAKGEVLENGENVLSAKSAMWKSGGKDPAKLLMQPEPFKAALEKQEAAKPKAKTKPE